jgi:hypothetical protein
LQFLGDQKVLSPGVQGVLENGEESGEALVGLPLSVDEDVHVVRKLSVAAGDGSESPDDAGKTVPDALAVVADHLGELAESNLGHVLEGVLEEAGVEAPGLGGVSVLVGGEEELLFFDLHEGEHGGVVLDAAVIIRQVVQFGD